MEKMKGKPFRQYGLLLIVWILLLFTLWNWVRTYRQPYLPYDAQEAEAK